VPRRAVPFATEAPVTLLCASLQSPVSFEAEAKRRRPAAVTLLSTPPAFSRSPKPTGPFALTNSLRRAICPNMLRPALLSAAALGRSLVNGGVLLPGLAAAGPRFFTAQPSFVDVDRPAVSGRPGCCKLNRRAGRRAACLPPLQRQEYNMLCRIAGTRLHFPSARSAGRTQHCAEATHQPGGERPLLIPVRLPKVSATAHLADMVGVHYAIQHVHGIIRLICF
jgi:hypothetical protein